MAIVEEFPYVLTEHAKKRIEERDIQLEWIRDVLENPQKIEIDPDDSSKVHAFKTIPDRGDRVLRVIYNHTVTPWRIISAYFDRSRKGKL